MMWGAPILGNLHTWQIRGAACLAGVVSIRAACQRPCWGAWTEFTLWTFNVAIENSNLYTGWCFCNHLEKWWSSSMGRIILYIMGKMLETTNQYSWFIYLQNIEIFHSIAILVYHQRVRTKDDNSKIQTIRKLLHWHWFQFQVVTLQAKHRDKQWDLSPANFGK